MDKKKLQHQIITDFGFSPIMASLFITGLELGPTLMMPLAKKAEVKRSTAYYIMEELLRRGFFTTKKIGRRTAYIAVSPEQLLKMTTEREQRLKKLIPLLTQISKNSP